MRLEIRIWLGIIAACAGLNLRAEPLLKDGDRMVFLGDSITEQKIYTRDVMNFFSLRYPDARIAFRNVGWNGEMADGGLRRLERDVLSFKPTLVSVSYGMNDGGYGRFDQAAYTNYLANMTGIVHRLQAAGVKVVLLTPGCVDPDQYFRWKPFDGKVYNETLARFAAGVKELAAQAGTPVCDLHTRMLDIQTRAKRDNPKFTMLPDMIHPDSFGHAVMTYGLLKTLGCDDQPSGMALDVSSGLVKADRCTVTDLVIAAKSVSFARRDAALPTHMEPAAQAGLKYLPFEQDLNQYRFAVSGLAAGKWRLKVQGLDVGDYTNTELAQGVNLASRPGPWLELGRQVNRLSQEFEDAYYVRWRQLGLPFDWLQFRLPELKPDVASLLNKIDSTNVQREQARRTAVSERTWRWELRMEGNAL